MRDRRKRAHYLEISLLDNSASLKGLIYVCGGFVFAKDRPQSHHIGTQEVHKAAGILRYLPHFHPCINSTTGRTVSKTFKASVPVKVESFATERGETTNRNTIF